MTITVLMMRQMKADCLTGKILNIYKIIPSTGVEGPGRRFCIWVQGCKKHCKGCFAKETWAFGTGKNYSTDELWQSIRQEKNIEGITLLGGEPFEQAEALVELTNKVKSAGLSVVCFTGNTIEELKTFQNPSVSQLLNNIDLLIDGGFEQENFDLSRPWVGSSNQRYIFLTDFYTPEDIKKFKNKIEVRISDNGKLEINGMGDFEHFQKEFCLQLGKNDVK